MQSFPFAEEDTETWRSETTGPRSRSLLASVPGFAWLSCWCPVCRQNSDAFVDHKPGQRATPLPVQGPDPARLQACRIKGVRNQALSLASAHPGGGGGGKFLTSFPGSSQSRQPSCLPAAYPPGCGQASWGSIRCCWVSIFPSSFGRAPSRSLSNKQIWRKLKSWLSLLKSCGAPSME